MFHTQTFQLWVPHLHQDFSGPSTDSLALYQEGHFNSEVKGSKSRFLQEPFCQLNLENQLSKAGVIVALICPSYPGKALLGF